MAASTEMICLECPLACHLELTLDDQGAIVECLGAQCKRGLPYARRELQGAERLLTTTVLTESSRTPLLAVRTDRPMARGRLKEAMNSLACLTVKPPVHPGQVLLPNLLGTEANVLASDELLE